MTEKFPRWPLLASLLAYFALTVALIVVVPLNNLDNLHGAPDEAAHWQYVQHIATVGSLPVFRGDPPPAPGYEFHQPPLYYLICAPLWKMLGAGVQNYACRVVSMLCGLLTIWVIWNAAKLVFPQSWRIAAVAAGFSALLPLHQAVGAGSNNDALSGLICATLFFLIARLWLAGPTWKDVWQIGLVSGLGVATKNTTLTVAAISFVALFAATNSSSKEDAPRPIMAVGAAFLVLLLLGGPIWMRNQMLYGDALAQGIFNKAFRNASVGPVQMGLDLPTYFSKLAVVVFCTLWGFFGGPNTVIRETHLFNPSPYLSQSALALPMLLCVLAPLVALLGLRSTRATAETPSSPKALTINWVLGIVFVLLAWAQFAAQYFAGGQARYGHAALLPVCVFLALGWVRFWGQGRALAFASAFFGLVLIGLTLLNVSVWKTLV